MKLSSKIMGGYLLIAGMVLGIGYSSNQALDNTQTHYDKTVSKLLPVFEMMEILRSNAVAIGFHSNEAGIMVMAQLLNQQASPGKRSEIVKKQTENLEEISIPSFLELFDELFVQATSLYPESEPLISQLITTGHSLVAAARNLVSFSPNKLKNHIILDHESALSEEIVKFIGTLNEIEEFYQDKLSDEKAALEDSLNNGFLATQIIITLAFVAALGFGVLTTRSISIPINKLKDAAQQIGQGHFETRVQIKSQDEIGVLAEQFNLMTGNLEKTTVTKNYIENILASMADSLIVVDINDKIVKANSAACKIFGYEEYDLFQKELSSLLDADEETIKQWLYSSNSSELFQTDTSFISKNDDAIPVQLSISSLSDDDGRRTGKILMAQDIRERLRQEKVITESYKQLEQSNKQLDQFAYVVSHDLKAPLRAIANLAEWIEEDIEQAISEDARKQFELLKGRVHRMEALINGILEYSRVGRVEINIDTIDTRKLVDDVLDMMPTPDGFKVNINGDYPEIDSAKVQLSQVFANLISNAIKYTDRDDGVIDIKGIDQGESVQFSVTDNGPGIAPQFHSKVFEMFQTLNARDKVESTGVGLTLVKRIVEDLGGSIRVESEEGEGATFLFNLPKKFTNHREIRA